MSGMLIGIINILTAIFAIQINQSVDYIDFVYVLGLNIKIEYILTIILAVPIIINIIYIIIKKQTKQTILCSIAIVLMLACTVITIFALANRIANIWSVIVAIWIIILAIIHITINMKDYIRINIATSIIFCILSIILVALIYVMTLIGVKYKEYIKTEKDKNTNNYQYVKLYLVKDEKYGYIDSNGKKIVSCNYDEIIMPFENKNLAILKENNEIKIINNKGDIILHADEKYNVNFIKKLTQEISVECVNNKVSYKENRYIVLEQIKDNIYGYNDKYNLYYNNYYDEEKQKQVCDCKLIDRNTGLDFLVIDTFGLPSDGNKIYIYKNYNIPFINDEERGYYAPDGKKYLINSDDMYVVHFDSSNILFKDKDYYVFNNLQESYKKVYILEDIYIAELKNGKYKVLDRNLKAIANGLTDIEICDEVIIYSKNNKTYGLMDKQGKNITECKYEEIKGRQNYENNLLEKLETVYED